jgi:hypothetical protein
LSTPKRLRVIGGVFYTMHFFDKKYLKNRKNAYKNKREVGNGAAL